MYWEWGWEVHHIWIRHEYHNFIYAFVWMSFRIQWQLNISSNVPADQSFINNDCNYYTLITTIIIQKMLPHLPNRNILMNNAFSAHELDCVMPMFWHNYNQTALNQLVSEFVRKISMQSKRCEYFELRNVYINTAVCAVWSLYEEKIPMNMDFNPFI